MDNMEKLYSLTVGSIRKLLADWDADLILDDIIDRLNLDTYLEEDAEDDEYWDEYDEDENEEDCWDDEDDDYDDEDWYDEDEEEDYDEIEEGYSLDTPEHDDVAASIARDIRNGEYTLSAIRYLYAPEVIARIEELI